MLAVVAHRRTGLRGRVMVENRERAAPQKHNRVWMSRRMREALRIRMKYPARYAMFAVAFVAMMAGLLAATTPSSQELKVRMFPAAPYARSLFGDDLVQTGSGKSEVLRSTASVHTGQIFAER